MLNHRHAFRMNACVAGAASLTLVMAAIAGPPCYVLVGGLCCSKGVTGGPNLNRQCEDVVEDIPCPDVIRGNGTYVYSVLTTSGGQRNAVDDGAPIDAWCMWDYYECTPQGCVPTGVTAHFFCPGEVLSGPSC